MKKVTIVLVVACVWMGTVHPEKNVYLERLKINFLNNWNPTTPYELYVKSDLQEIENNPAVQQVAKVGLEKLGPMNKAVLKKAHENYQWGVILLEKALKKNWLGSCKIKNSLDRSALKHMLRMYTAGEKVLADAISSKVLEQISLEGKLMAAILVRKQQAAQAQEVTDTLLDLEVLVENLKWSHIAEELEDEDFIEESQKLISSVDDPALMKKIASAIAMAQRLSDAYKDEEGEAVNAHLDFLNNWHNALQSSQVAPNNRTISKIVVTPPDNNDKGVSESDRIIDNTESYV